MAAAAWVLFGMFLAALLVAQGGCETTVSDKDIRFVGLAEVRSLMDKQASSPQTVLLIDPRPAAAYASAHIPGAQNIELPRVDEKSGRDPRLERYAHLIVYGEHPASATAKAMTKRLLRMKYRGVRMFEGGLKEWTDRGLPTRSPEPAGGAQ